MTLNFNRVLKVIEKFVRNFIKLRAAVHGIVLIEKKTNNQIRLRKQYCRRFRGQ